jgi:hypothetical protein
MVTCSYKKTGSTSIKWSGSANLVAIGRDGHGLVGAIKELFQRVKYETTMSSGILECKTISC